MEISKVDSVKYTTEGLRMALIDEINGLRNGTTTLAKAKIVSDLAKQVFNICKLEADVLLSQEKGKKMLPVNLVSPVEGTTIVAQE